MLPLLISQSIFNSTLLTYVSDHHQSSNEHGNAEEALKNLPVEANRTNSRNIVQNECCKTFQIHELMKIKT